MSVSLPVFSCCARLFQGKKLDTPSRTIGRLCLSSIVFIGAFLIAFAPASAETVAIGVLSFNTLIPGTPISPGINDFAIDNFTGSFALPQDFPATQPLVFLGSTLALDLTGGVHQTLNLGDLAPGSYTPTSAQFLDTTTFVSARLTATLSATTFLLANGSSFHADGPSISIFLLPSSGSTLSPDLDFAPIVVSGGSAVAPEPESARLLAVTAVAIFGLMLFTRLARYDVRRV